MAQMTYLRIEGALTRGGWTYTPRPGHEASRIPDEFQSQLDAQAATDIEVALLGSGDALMARVKPRLRRPVCGSDPAGAPFQLAAYVPLLPGASAYQVRNAGVILYSAAIPQNAPAAEIVHCALDGDTVTAEWRVSGLGAGATAYFRVACLVGSRTFPLAVLQDQNRLTADLSRVPGPGAAYISVMGGDGVRSAVVLSQSFQLPARPPVIVLLSPTDQRSYGFHEPITLSGAAMDTGGRNLPDQELEWLLDGQVTAQGKRAAVVTSATPGQHQVTLSAGGARQSVTITVRDQTASDLEWSKIFGVSKLS